MKFDKNIVIALAVVCALGFGAYSTGILSKKQARIETEKKVHPLHDDATFNAAKKTFAIKPFNKNELEFSIDLPTDWEIEKALEDPTQSLSQKILGNVVTIKSPMINTARAIIRVQTMRPEHEISAQNWMKGYMLQNGYAPQGDMIVIDNKNASAAFISTSEGRSLYTYASVHINGGTIMLARFDVPAGLKEHTAYLQKKTIDSFKITNINDDPIEKQLSYTMADALKFEYPQSWQLSATNVRDINRLSIRLNNKNSMGQLEGIIFIQAIRRSPSTSFLLEVENLKKYFADTLGLEFNTLLTSDESKAYDRFIFNRLETYNISSKKNAASVQEMHLTALGDKGWYIFAYLITPREQENLYTWARNTKTFNDIIKSSR